MAETPHPAEPADHDSPLNQPMSRRDFLRSITAGVAAAVLLDPSEATAQNESQELHQLERINRWFEFRQGTLPFAPLEHRNHELEQRVQRITTIAQPLLSGTVPLTEKAQIQQRLLAELRGGTPASNGSDPTDGIMDAYHELQQQLAAAGYYLEVDSQGLGATSPDGTMHLTQLIFVPTNLRPVQAVHEQTIDHFWNDEPLTYRTVTVGLPITDQGGQPLVPHINVTGQSESGVSAEYGALVNDVQAIDTVHGLRRRIAQLQADHDRMARYAAIPPEQGFLLFRQEPTNTISLAKQRYEAIVAPLMAKTDPAALKQFADVGQQVHEASHLYFDHLALATHQVVHRINTESLHPGAIQAAETNHTVKAEAGAFLGELLYTPGELPDQLRWYPLYRLLDAANERTADPDHGLAAEWLLREFVSRVAANPAEFGLTNAESLTEPDRSLMIWAQLDQIATSGDPAVQRAAWQDIADTYRANLASDFITNDQQQVIERPVERHHEPNGIHSSWLGWAGAAVTAVVGGAAGLAFWRKHRMDEHAAKQLAAEAQSKTKKKSGKKRR